MLGHPGVEVGAVVAHGAAELYEARTTALDAFDLEELLRDAEVACGLDGVEVDLVHLGIKNIPSRTALMRVLQASVAEAGIAQVDI